MQNWNTCSVAQEHHSSPQHHVDYLNSCTAIFPMFWPVNIYWKRQNKHHFKPIYSPEKKPHNLTPTHFSRKLLHHHHSYDIIMVLPLFSIGNRNQPTINTVHIPVSWFNKTVCHIQFKGTRVLKSCLVQEGQHLVHSKMRSNFKKMNIHDFVLKCSLDLVFYLQSDFWQYWL